MLDGTTTFAVAVCAESIRQAVQMVEDRYPGRAVGVAFPIEPESFFMEGAPPWRKYPPSHAGEAGRSENMIGAYE